MTLWKASKVELATAIVAALALPFYLGFVHAGVPGLLLYSGVAGTAMAGGEFAELSHLQQGGLRLFVSNVVLWMAVIGSIGGPSYFFALMF